MRICDRCGTYRENDPLTPHEFGLFKQHENGSNPVRSRTVDLCSSCADAIAQKVHAFCVEEFQCSLTRPSRSAR